MTFLSPAEFLDPTPPAPVMRSRAVNLLDVPGGGRPRKKRVRSEASKRQRSEYGRIYRARNAERIAANKAKWAKEHAMEIRVYRRIWAREKRKNLVRKHLRGEANASAKLTAERVKTMRARYAQGGISIKALGSAFGVTPTAAWKVVNRESWRHVA